MNVSEVSGTFGNQNKFIGTDWTTDLKYDWDFVSYQQISKLNLHLMYFKIY